MAGSMGTVRGTCFLQRDSESAPPGASAQPIIGPILAPNDHGIGWYTDASVSPLIMPLMMPMFPFSASERHRETTSPAKVPLRKAEAVHAKSQPAESDKNDGLAPDAVGDARPIEDCKGLGGEEETLLVPPS